MSTQRSFIKMSLLTIFTILVLNLASTTNAQVVCSLDELIRELYDDIIDNGKINITNIIRILIISLQNV